MWKLSISGVEELENDPNYGVQWEPVKEKGTVPGKISHHKAAVFGNQVVIYGGMTGIDEIEDVYEFDVSKESWAKLKQTGDVPKPRDDHSLAQIDDERFIIFGGFVDGSRTNECFVCTKVNNTLQWKQVGADSPQAPCIRASHSASVYEGKMYIFGGQDDENNKLNDIWEFDIEQEVFSQIELPDDSYQPPPRSGHSSTIFKAKMFLFGGILELTKELNELLAFDFATRKFQLMGNQQVY